MLTVEVLQEFSRRENLNAQMSSVFQRYLALANQVLSWNFLPPNYILLMLGPLFQLPWVISKVFVRGKKNVELTSLIFSP